MLLEARCAALGIGHYARIERFDPTVGASWRFAEPQLALKVSSTSSH